MKSSSYQSPYDLETAPLDYIVIHNRSKNAANFAITQLKKAWPWLRIIQVVQDNRESSAAADFTINIADGEWSNMEHFKSKFDELAKSHSQLQYSMEKGKIGFYPVWSAAAENPDWARAAQEKGFKWIGASPDKMEGLDKIHYKRLCQSLDLSTADFMEVKAPENQNEEEAFKVMAKDLVDLYRRSALNGKAIFVKHNEGGGGRGSKKVSDVTEANALEAIRKIVKETGGNLNGVYFEEALDLEDSLMFQIEIEGDGSELAQGARLVWFNKENQKVLEVGLTDEAILKFIPKEIYEQCRAASKAVFEASGYDNRGTNEILLVRDKQGNWRFYNSELNKRIQVENRALADLVVDDQGRVKNVPAEQVMRSLGFPAPKETDFQFKGKAIAGHVRLLSCKVTPTGSEYPSGLVIDNAFCPEGVRLEDDGPKGVGPGGIGVNYVKGNVYLDADPQLGSALLEADSWEEFCDRLLTFSQEFQFTGPKTEQSTYFDFLRKLASNPQFRCGELGCNKALDVLADYDVEKGQVQKVVASLAHSVAPLVIQGYRPGEGVEDQPYPTKGQVQKFNDYMGKLGEAVPETPFSRFLAHQDFNKYIADLKEWLKQHGGGSVTVIRDVQQSQADQESALIQDASARMAERHFAASGMGVGFEVGGAQYQAALLRGIDWWSLVLTGCLSNLPSHSLTRSAWLNGLELKPLEVQEFVFKTIRDEVCKHYGVSAEKMTFVPWMPYNFHAGNHPKQDITTRAMLRANLGVIPNWAWDPRFTDDHFKSWVLRQIQLFKDEGKPLSQIRIKNPGQGPNWNEATILHLVEMILDEFKTSGLDQPIIFIHNHEFDGAASRIGGNALKACRDRLDYHYLVMDSAPPGTSHNSNIVIADGLKISPPEMESLREYNKGERLALNLTSRFNNQSQTRDHVDHSSGMAGGTISSDFADAKKLGIPNTAVHRAIVLAKDLIGLGTPVTPFSEWIKQIGFAIWTNNNIQSKTLEAARDYIQNGGRLDVAKSILEGLQAWETLLQRPPIVEQLLKNHGMALHPLEVKAEPVDIEKERKKLERELPGAKVNDKDLCTYLAFGQIGLDFLRKRHGSQPTQRPREVTHFMKDPGFVHKQFREKGDSFMLHGEKITIAQINDNKDGTVDVSFEYQNQIIRTRGVDPKQLSSVAIRMVQDPEREIAPPKAAKITRYLVEPGQEVKKDQPVAEVELMKMSVTLFAPVCGVVGYVRDINLRERIAEPGEVLVALKA